MTAILGLITAVSWAFSNLFTHQLSRLKIEQTVVMAGIIGVATLALVPVAIVVDYGNVTFTVENLAWSVLGGVFSVFGLLTLVRALSVGSLSVVAPIIALEGGIAVVMSVALGERPSLLQYALMATAVLGAMVVSLEPSRRTVAGAIPAVLSAISFAAAWVSVGMSDLPSLTTVAVTRGTGFVIVLALVLVFAKQRVPPRASIVPFLACGLLDALGYVTFGLATAVGSIAVASVAATQWTTAAAIIGITILRERLRPIQYAGIVVTLVSVSALVIAS